MTYLITEYPQSSAQQYPIHHGADTTEREERESPDQVDPVDAPLARASRALPLLRTNAVGTSSPSQLIICLVCLCTLQSLPAHSVLVVPSPTLFVSAPSAISLPAGENSIPAPRSIIRPRRRLRVLLHSLESCLRPSTVIFHLASFQSSH